METQKSADVFEISRIFDAPQALVFEAWTSADHLKQWFGPKGTKLDYATVDLRPGGMFHYMILAPDGKSMWGKWVYTEIDRPTKISYVFSFSDEKGGVTRAPFGFDFPMEVYSTVTFTSEADGRTRVTMHNVPKNATESELRAFGSMTESMTKGWTGTFEQFDEFLANASAASGRSAPRPA